MFSERVSDTRARQWLWHTDHGRDVDLLHEIGEEAADLDEALGRDLWRDRHRVIHTEGVSVAYRMAAEMCPCTEQGGPRHPWGFGAPDSGREWLRSPAESHLLPLLVHSEQPELDPS